MRSSLFTSFQRRGVETRVTRPEKPGVKEVLLSRRVAPLSIMAVGACVGVAVNCGANADHKPPVLTQWAAIAKDVRPLCDLWGILSTVGPNPRRPGTVYRGLDSASRRASEVPPPRVPNHLAGRQVAAFAHRDTTAPCLSSETPVMKETSWAPATSEAFGNSELPSDMRSLPTLGPGSLPFIPAFLNEAAAPVGSSRRVTPLWRFYFDRGRDLVTRDRLAQALAHFRLCLALVRHAQPTHQPASRVQASWEPPFEDVFSSFIDTGNQLYFAGGAAGLVRETFELAEEMKRDNSCTVRCMAEESHTKARPHSRGAPAGLGAIGPRLAVGDCLVAGHRVREPQWLPPEIAASAGLRSCGLTNSGPNGGDLLTRTQEVLSSDEALLSFHLGESRSYLWAVTRAEVQLHRLPSRSRIQRSVRRFVEAIQQNSAEALRLGECTYRDLCRGFNEIARSKAHWLLALDGILFDLPFAALPEVAGPGRPTFLIEGHSLQVVAGAHQLVASRAQGAPIPAVGTDLVAVGDPVYNRADPRWTGNLKEALDGRDFVELPRLPGSGWEIRACGSLWAISGSQPILLEGSRTSRETVLRIVQRRPVVIHFATHIVPSERELGFIALSLLPCGSVGLLNPLEIASSDLGPQLVVLSGCSPVNRDHRVATGLESFVKTWLAAGAATLVASRWQTPDDSGELFIRFYRELRPWAGSGPATRVAVALQRAQLEMLRGSTWRSSPRYWGAYFALSRQ